MGIIKKALEDAKSEIDAIKQSAAAQMQRSTTAGFGASIDETLDDTDLDPQVREMLLKSLVDTRDSELERISQRFQ